MEIFILFKNIFEFIFVLMIAVIVHEAGHTITALLCGVKVEAFGIGFGKPLLSKTFKGIKFNFSPILMGGYTKLYGEYKKVSNGFLSQPYHKKAIILVSGVTMNILLASLCYLINYKSLETGFWVDCQIMKSMFVKTNMDSWMYIFTTLKPNLFLLQLSLMNMFCGLFNLIPFPALDGSMLWILGLEKGFKSTKKFSIFVKKICYIGFVLLILAQLIYVWWFLIYRGI